MLAIGVARSDKHPPSHWLAPAPLIRAPPRIRVFMCPRVFLIAHASPKLQLLRRYVASLGQMAQSGRSGSKRNVESIHGSSQLDADVEPSLIRRLLKYFSRSAILRFLLEQPAFRKSKPARVFAKRVSPPRPVERVGDPRAPYRRV